MGCLFRIIVLNCIFLVSAVSIFQNSDFPGILKSDYYIDPQKLVAKGNCSRVVGEITPCSVSDNLSQLTYAIARASPAENGAFFYPAENMPLEGVHFTSLRNPAPMSNAYISSSNSVEVSHYQPDVSGPSHDPFQHSSTDGSFCTVPENHAHHASSSNYDRQTFNGVEGGLVDLTMGNGRGPHKRKSPVVPSACEGGSTSRYYGAGSSSDTPLSCHPFDHSSSLDFSGQSSSAMTHDWSHTGVSVASGRMLVADVNGYSHETNHFLVGSSITNASADVRDIIMISFQVETLLLLRVSIVPQHILQPRLLSTVAWRNSDRNGRSRNSYERYHEPSLHDRFSSEGFMVVDRSAFYGSRNMFDQHRDMRLDTDNMSYEELLALGERIGSVSTGLAEGLISKCLTETVYCSSGQSQDEGTCVICLEEYKDMDDVGSLKICGHDYHVSCIKKWLSMKNLCPICKASAAADNMKE
ncbi:hypothetical protein GH714_039301 [Hevea brasiliensis]|uniref:RING-type E3 ubiquitin transferase n=1 Tax=Hevea brasiliensis TaxID=3981 RepID=A0A6A6KNU8_HEVBR|nr:hypothetical protein GH714_039301 [Hevea brasiliensis]